MKKICFTFYFTLIMASVIAQENYRYKVHIVGRNGIEIKKDYASLDALTNDKELEKLAIGTEKNGKFEFQPDERKHKKFYVERLGGKEREFIFQAWGSPSRADSSAVPAPPPPPEFGSRNSKPAESFGEFPIDENEIINELMKDNLVSNISRVKIEFLGKDFFVNDNKQSRQLQKKYKELLEKKSGRKIRSHFIYEFSVK